MNKKRCVKYNEGDSINIMIYNDIHHYNNVSNRKANWQNKS